jgi:hypothetical protein
MTEQRHVNKQCSYFIQHDSYLVTCIIFVRNHDNHKRRPIMLMENAVLQSLFVILSNLQLIMNLFAFSLKFRAHTRFRALLEIPRANANSAQFRVNSARADSVWP